MNIEERKKIVKHHLIDKDMSFRTWCKENNVPYSVARDLVYGRLTGNKSEKSRIVKEIIMKEFGDTIFD